jgi:LysR family glycine cleavage system transcriptional activator
MGGYLRLLHRPRKRDILALPIEKIYPDPMHRLPPLNGLRAFEATARLRSMKRAADELGVTPGAVSQLIRRLEERLNKPLFRRANRALVLTEAGQMFFPAVRHAFGEIDGATRRLELESFAGTRNLSVSVPPAFAAMWLVPRLGRFRDRHPTIDLRIITTRTLANFGPDGVDAAIRHGLGRYKGLRSDRITPAVLIPVASPDLLAPLDRHPRSPADLLDLPLLHGADRQEWAFWFEAHGIADPGPAIARGSSFDDQILLIRAAASGQGAALATEALVEPEFAAGTLVRLLETQWPQDHAYWLVCPESVVNQPRIRAFREWLLSESAR